MPPPQIMAVAAIAVVLYLGGSAVVRGVQKIEHKIVHVFHKRKPKAAPEVPHADAH